MKMYINLLALFLACMVLPGKVTSLKAGSQPSIIFFLVDDQRNDTLGCAGHPIIKTPHVDELARKGIRFNNMFVTTSICAASRASIFTGLVERTHRYTFGTPPIQNLHAEQSYPLILKKRGYRTGFIGKFGVSLSSEIRERMFDVYLPHGRNPYLKKMPDGTLRHETEIAGDKAIDFLQKNPKGTPFCLSISFNAVHAEDGDRRPGIGHYPTPQSVQGMYEGTTIPPARLSDPAIFKSQPPFLRESYNRVRFFWRWDTPDKFQTNMKAYFRMISGVDHAIGRVLAELKRQKIAENTVIIYSGDNGYYMGQRGFAGKWSHYEESLRVPLIIYDPRLTESLPSRSIDAMALNIDLPATMIDLAGATIPRHYQGKSLISFLKRDPPKQWRSDFFCEHLMDRKEIPKWEGVRGSRYVYAHYFEHEYEFLHDLKTDPDQLKNLATHAKYATILKEMQARCMELRDQYGGPYRPRLKKRKNKQAN